MSARGYGLHSVCPQCFFSRRRHPMMRRPEYQFFSSQTSTIWNLAIVNISLLLIKYANGSKILFPNKQNFCHLSHKNHLRKIIQIRSNTKESNRILISITSLLKIVDIWGGKAWYYVKESWMNEWFDSTNRNILHQEKIVCDIYYFAVGRSEKSYESLRYIGHALKMKFVSRKFCLFVPNLPLTISLNFASIWFSFFQRVNGAILKTKYERAQSLLSHGSGNEMSACPIDILVLPPKPPPDRPKMTSQRDGTLSYVSPVILSFRTVVRTNTPPTDQAGNARTNMWWFANRYAKKPPLSSSDFCHHNEKFHKRWR